MPIDRWRPGVGFVDRQLRSPCAKWIHTHSFERSDTGTLVRDHVEYALPLDPLSRPAQRPSVKPTVERIFAHRREAIARILGGGPTLAITP
jgi:ligand-binding SRPBCC domain-containing protein